MRTASQEDFYLNRRGGLRVDFRHAIRFQSNPDRRFQLAHAITQNLSLRGMQVLSATILDSRKKFEVWIPIDGTTVIPAIARTEWMTVEDTLADSPYWVRGGLSLAFPKEKDRKLYVETVLKRVDIDRLKKEAESSKVGFVF
ncbi:MAG: hypothetical protein V1495_01050 [Pseudomonadota bacterium]